jgi:hypothetical protein
MEFHASLSLFQSPQWLSEINQKIPQQQKKYPHRVYVSEPKIYVIYTSLVMAVAKRQIKTM